MKVEELIQELKKCNPDADVEIIDIEGNYSCDAETVDFCLQYILQPYC